MDPTQLLHLGLQQKVKVKAKTKTKNNNRQNDTDQIKTKNKTTTLTGNNNNNPPPPTASPSQQLSYFLSQFQSGNEVQLSSLELESNKGKIKFINQRLLKLKKGHFFFFYIFV